MHIFNTLVWNFTYSQHKKHFSSRTWHSSHISQHHAATQGLTVGKWIGLASFKFRLTFFKLPFFKLLLQLPTFLPYLLISLCKHFFLLKWWEIIALSQWRFSPGDAMAMSLQAATSSWHHAGDAVSLSQWAERWRWLLSQQGEWPAWHMRGSHQAAVQWPHLAREG